MAYYTLGLKPQTYVIRVYEPGRGRKTIERKIVHDYNKAIQLHNEMKSIYSDRYIVELIPRSGI